MRTVILAAIGLALVAGRPSRCLAEDGWVYRDQTGPVVTLIHLQVVRSDDTVTIESTLSDGDLHRVVTDALRATLRYFFASPARGSAYTATRVGNEIVLEGTLKGKPLSRRIPIDSHPWYESMEWSLQQFAVAAPSAPQVFWVVHPYEARAYLMQAQEEKEESVLVNGRTLEAMRVKVSPWGILSLFWSSLYWFRPSDGAFVRYEGVRGLPGTPKTVVELLKES